jgi:ATP-dependent phosphoenolpyruvate carboxykinase
MVPGAPTPGEVVANGYNSIEAGPVLLQLGGTDPADLGLPPSAYPYKPRPEVDKGIFKHKNRVKLTIVSDEFDKMMYPDDEWNLYKYLTKKKHGKRFFVVLGDETCHDTHISDPHAIVALLDKPYIFKSSEVEEDITFTQNVKVYPNPVSSNSTIEVKLDQNTYLELSIYNQVGQLIETIYNGQMEKGNHTFHFNTEKLPVGLYTLRVQSGDKSEVIKIIKTK